MNKRIQGPAIEAKVESDRGLIEGHGAIFGNVDLGGDIIQRGAFSRTIAKLKSEGRAPAMLWSHNMDRPIGKWTEFKEDERGLFMRGQINLGTRDGRDAYAHAREKSAVGLSIGYATLKSDYDTQGNRLLKDLELYEVSIVSLPMNTQAGITNVKLLTPRHAERWLRSHGMSRTAAVKLVAGGWKALSGEAIELSEAIDNLLGRATSPAKHVAQSDYQRAAAGFSDALAHLREQLNAME
jgi:HK97 family phage prohead protease